MKKVISIMVVLCVAAALFATGTVKVGGAFDFVDGKTAKFEAGAFGSSMLYKTNGFGFDVSGRYDVSGGFSVWADFNMTFNSDIKIKAEGAGEWASLSDIAEGLEEEIGGAAKAKTSVYDMSGAVGVAIKLPVAPVVDLAVGGGVFAETVTIKGSASVPENVNTSIHNLEVTYRFVNIGVTAYADAAYKFTPNFGVGLTIMPRVGLLNFSTISGARDKEVETYKARGFAASFSMPVVVGVSYSF